MFFEGLRTHEYVNDDGNARSFVRSSTYCHEASDCAPLDGSSVAPIVETIWATLAEKSVTEDEILGTRRPLLEFVGSWRTLPSKPQGPYSI